MPSKKPSAAGDMPDTVARSDRHVQDLWRVVHARAVQRFGKGVSAERVALAALEKEYRQQGDRWVRKTRQALPRQPARRGAIPRPTSTVRNGASTTRHGPPHPAKRAHARAKPEKREQGRSDHARGNKKREAHPGRRNPGRRGGESGARIKTVVVDGSNVAYTEKTNDGKPKVSNLMAVQRALRDRGRRPIIIVDAALRHQVDDSARLEELIQRQEIRQAPADTDADYFILQTAENEQADIVSNDEYQPYRQQFPWIAKRRIPLMIVQGAVELYERSHRGRG